MTLVQLLVFVVLACVIETLCLAIAYRIHRGRKGLGIPASELWKKALIAGVFFGLAGVVGLLIGLELELGSRSFLIVCTQAVFIPIGAQVINWIYGLDDWPAGAGIYFLRVLPGLAIIIPLLFLS